jgi:hypothetical protein
MVPELCKFKVLGFRILLQFFDMITDQFTMGYYNNFNNIFLKKYKEISEIKKIIDVFFYF